MTATVQLWRSVCYNSPGSSLSSRRVLSLLSPLSLVGVLTDKHKLHQFNFLGSKMQIRVDENFIKEMNRRLGTKITFSEFKSLYEEIETARFSSTISKIRKMKRSKGVLVVNK